MLLTLALPVFNDAKALVASLDSVISALREVEQPVEVIVSDNCSSDGSFEAAQSSLGNFPNSRVVRQNMNLGFAGNLKALSELSSAKYIWYLGAGDTLRPGHLAPIIRVLNEESPDFGTLHGSFNFHELPGKELETTRFSIAKGNQNSSVSLFNHAVSLNIIKREIMLALSAPKNSSTASSKNNLESIPNPLYLWESETSYWPHLEAICQFLERGESEDKIWFEYEGLAVLLDNNKNGNWDKGLSAVKIFVEWASVAKRAASALPKARAAQMLDGILHGKHLLKFLFMIRKDGAIPPPLAVVQIKSMDINFAIRCLSLLISHLPIPVVRSLVCARSLFVKPL
jgi:glycosyltransferase involved in cell wall biosynthesis